MSDGEPQSTQRDMRPSIVAELEAAGFEDAVEIGRGGFGVVYRCAQTSLDRTVAIKVLSSDLDAENVDRFLREEHAMGRLSGHPNIVDILQVDVTLTGRPYIVMPFHAQGSLDDLIRTSGPLSWSAALRIGVKLAGAIESAHRAGILHRDVKPANILVTAYGEPQLTDFGIARVPGSFETSSAMITGSPAYTAPEVLTGRPPTAASDVYGLGATLFALVTGHAAFERRTGEKVVAQFLRITTEPIPDLTGSDIPPDVSGAIEAAMAHDPTDRPSTAAAFGDMLREIEANNGLPVDEMALLSADAITAAAEPRTSNPTPTRSRERTSTSAVPRTAATKFRPPSHARAWLPRPRLIDVLRAGKQRRLTVIHAPAGFGKTTLVAQWRDVLTGAGISVAWLSVDLDDNNVVWFLTHLVEAVQRVRPELADGLADSLEDQAEDAQRYVLTSLIDQIHESGETVAVVVDDWQRITDEGVVRALDFLIENGCHHLRIIVSSRSRAGLPLSRMRVRDELVEIDSDALRLSVDEARAFLVDRNGLRLTDSDVAGLCESTEGWFAALQLVSLSLSNHADPADLIHRLSGRHHAIGEYLVENVLDMLEPRMLEFLLSICVAERVSGDLASTLADTDDGQAMLEEAEERDLFLRRIDDDREWFRFQLLFADFLRRRLERDQPGRARSLHLKASIWFAEHQFLREAVDHAIAAADLKRALELVETSGMELIDGSRLATLLGLVAKLPTPQVVSRSKLMLAVAKANVSLHRSTAARSALDRISGLLDRNAATDNAARIEADVVKAAAEVGADRVVDIDQLVAECLEHPESVAAGVVSEAANAATFAALGRFEFDAARSRQSWARPYHQQSSGPLGLVHGYCYAGIAAREQLDFVSAAANFVQAQEVAATAEHARLHATRIANAMLGELRYEQGDVATAERLLDESRELGADLGVVDFLVAAYVTGARVKALRGDLTAAATILREGAAIASRRVLRRLAAHVHREQLRLGLPVAEIPVTVDDAATYDGIALATSQIVESTAIARLLAAHTLDSDDVACTRARKLANIIEMQNRPRAGQHAQLLLASALFAAGWLAEAKDIAVLCVARCAELGTGRVLLDGGPQVVELLAELRRDQLENRWQPHWPAVPKPFLEELTRSTD
ncbi:protein kinase [Antrihabitans sp. YC3-6]|uniref:Serine/threonine-protein kinase PknK n=1 Tax=Antrihabitans stalagmiti TaxID=2799499 RepID=A0A934U457_9NOCA|nr:serine/threonine-protein kinase [Antrihabitans stalagmiti]MBJ8340082.1 protein kinase [Antrihabitans stalagmiti]